MLKILLSLCFLLPFCFKQKLYWLVQNMLFFICFIFILMNNTVSFQKHISFFMGMDLVSYGLILLSIWICSLMIMASKKVYEMNNHYNLFLFLIICLLILLVLTFSSLNLFFFYIFFEGSLVPTLFLILGWGYQPERLQAGVYLLFYTLLASLPLLVGFFFLMDKTFSMNFLLMKNYCFNNFFLYISLLLAFLVKMPMFLVHLWLPKAHVEAPISGSMILAGVLLKLGGYGILRVFPFVLLNCLKFNFFWVSVSLIGGVLVSFICLRQVDLKSLIAYSSVAHMGLVLSGMMTLNYWGVCSAYTLMIAHGLCSSGLFCLANISYERLSSRSLLINKGLLNFMPSLTLWWFLLVASNMAAPPTLNLLGEIGLLMSIVSWSWVSMIFLSLLSFFSAAYSLYLYSYSQHGKVSSSSFSFMSGYVREYLVLFLHWYPLNLLILKSDSCIMWM